MSGAVWKSSLFPTGEFPCPGFGAGLRITSVFLVFLSLIFFQALPVGAQPLTVDADSVRRALSFFKKNQKDDGGFGSPETTLAVMEAIRCAGQDPDGWYHNDNTPAAFPCRARSDRRRRSRRRKGAPSAERWSQRFKGHYPKAATRWFILRQRR